MGNRAECGGGGRWGRGVGNLYYFFRDTNLITYLLRWVYVIYN